MLVPLQPIVDSIYARSRYGKQIDYTKPITPRLSAEESTSLAQRLAGTVENGKSERAGKRRTRRR